MKRLRAVQIKAEGKLDAILKCPDCGKQMYEGFHGKWIRLHRAQCLKRRGRK